MLAHTGVRFAFPLLLAAAATTCLVGDVGQGLAETAPNLGSRIQIDGDIYGYAWTDQVFGSNGAQVSVEPPDDSSWGDFRDLSAIFFCWDHRNLYVACWGRFWNANAVLFVDIIPEQGLTGMSQANSWRRNIFFTPDFAPDAMLGSWDGSWSARLLIHRSGDLVDDHASGQVFEGAAQSLDPYGLLCVEARIPWTTLYLNSAHGSAVERDTVIGGLPDTLVFLPPGTRLKIAGVVTGGPDGTGGGDVAPNNTAGCPTDIFGQLVVDNFAIVELDADLDGLPDMGVEPVERVTFKNVALPTRRSSWGRLKLRYN